MQCVNCGKPFGNPVPEACASCGVPIVMRERVQRDGAALNMLIPVGSSGWAVAAGFTGMLCLLVVPGPFAILLGIAALWHLKRRPDLNGRGRAWFAVVMGTLATLGLAAIIIGGRIG